MKDQLLMVKRKLRMMDISIFQTQVSGDTKGYKLVYSFKTEAKDHQDALEKTFRLFNVHDTVPADYTARFIQTGDILFIDEGRRGQEYYRLHSGGWKKINRIHVR
ncbi:MULTISPECIES: YodL domain-containing protein [Bacillaceae]|uniref:YodL domain-containing protein n=1 Tax=Metabacillus sediminis TaxID=3117746 RepID=A0ABZ2NBS7_9BACI|nr:YodL domain-containing protein [Bacillus sp. SJS]KZZ84276.1 hypothetical protein AS29_012000 [Bacillus sp. SJS]